MRWARGEAHRLFSCTKSVNNFFKIKAFFTRSHFYLFAITIVVATIHILFDFLAFKNDVNFWRKRKTMVGISTRFVSVQRLHTDDFGLFAEL